MTLENPNDISRMRIGDADRDRAASVLSEAMAEGRLTPQEHADRLDAIYAAKTHAEIVPVLSDLPGASAALSGSGTGLARASYSGEVAPAGRRTRLVALFGGVVRKGAWRVPQDLAAITVFGGAQLDLREAVLPPGEIRLRATCVLGGAEITVPPEMRVIDSTWAVMGGVEVPPDSPESQHPDAPVLHLSGVTIMGGISVRRRPRNTQ